MFLDVFLAKIQAAQKRGGSNLLLELSPRITTLPLPIQRFDEPFLPYGKAIIAATHDLVCGYLFDFAAYFSTGAAGIVALERTIAYAKTHRDVLTILDGTFAHSGFAEGAAALSVNAVTVADSVSRHEFEPYGITALTKEDLGIFTLISGAQTLSARDDDFALYIRNIALTAQAGQGAHSPDA